MTDEEVFIEPETVGRLMRIVPDPTTGYKFDIWFDYTRKLTNMISEGDLVAVPNFSDVDVYSICQIITALPTHFAMPHNLEGYPGFTMEAVKNASQDWLLQEEQSYEDTTKIVCKATPFYLQFKDIHIDEINQLVLEKEKAVVMPGKEAKLLSNQMLNRIMNMDINLEKNNIKIGNLLDNEAVNILLDVEYFIKLHFGVFGYTGVGKSNLISTIIRKIMQSENNLKIVLFDLSNEYTGLLIDLLSVTDINSQILSLSFETIPNSLVQFVSEEVDIAPPRDDLTSFMPREDSVEPVDSSSNDVNGLENAIDSVAEQFLDVTLLPKTIDTEDIRSLMLPYFKKIIFDKKIKILLQLTSESVRSFIERNKDESHLGAARISEINEIIETSLSAHLHSELSSECVGSCIRILNNTIPRQKNNTVRERLGHIVRKLNGVLEQFRINVNDDYSLTLEDLVDQLNDPAQKNLYIITAHDPNEIRLFSNRLVTELYESRREEGRSTPLVLFLIDEADEFIPSNPAGTYARSTRAIETLARRGRKYGLGVGLATQRVTYLNTSIMAQPHTYFVSRLPRQTDRERVAEAFAMDEDLFQQTFKFDKGDWLIMSHEALGIQGKPIPISVENAEDRIREFLSRPFGEYSLEDLNENGQE